MIFMIKHSREHRNDIKHESCHQAHVTIVSFIEEEPIERSDNDHLAKCQNT
jgi:hypothetical protein